MKSIYTRTIVALALLIGVILFTLPTNELKFLSESRTLEIETFEGENEVEKDKFENPIKRAEFEFMQLKDPRTNKVPAQIKLKELNFMQMQKEQATYKNAIRSEGKIAFSTQSTNSSDFINRGPYNVGGRTRALAIDAANENIILAGGISGGVWRTTNQGQSWTRTSASDQHPAVSTIVQDRRAGQTNTWFYATGEQRGNSASAFQGSAFYFGNGVYKSTDNGASWTLITSTTVSGTTGTEPVNVSTPFTLTDEIAIDYSNTTEREIYVGGAGQVIRTTDDFANFTTVLGASNNSGNMVDIKVTPTGVVYATIGSRFSNGAGAQEGVWRSNDGVNWTNITPASGLESGYWRLELGIDPRNEDKVWLVSDEALMVWDDVSKDWDDRSAALEIPADPDRRNIVTDFSTQFYYDQLVSVHPGNSDVIYIGGSNLFRSTDGFTTVGNKNHVAGYSSDQRIQFLYPNHHPDLHATVFFDSDPNKMITGDDGGIHITSNNLATNASFPITWESLNNGYVTSQFYHADINNVDFGDPIIIGGLQDNGTYIIQNTEDPEAEWIFIAGGDGAYAGYTYNSFYHSSQNGNYRRRDFEVDVNDVINITPISDAQRENEFFFANSFGYNLVNQDQVLIGGRQRAFFSPDIRTNPGIGDWLEITTPEMISSDANVTAMSWSVEPEGVLYMGTDFGQVMKITNTQEITENSRGVDLPTGDMPGGFINALKVDPADADHVIVTFTNYGVLSVWESTDGGQTWASISGNLEENADGSGVGPSVRSIEIMPDGNGGNYYFVGTSVGLYMTKTLVGDNTIWTQQSPDVIGDVVVSWISARPIEGLVMVSTHGNGTFTGTYDVGANAFLNYSFNPNEVSYTLRANRSQTNEQPLAYQWIKNGEVVAGESGPDLTITDGGLYQVRVFLSNDVSGLSNEVQINLDGSAPEVTSIKRFDPSEENVEAGRVTFEVTFNEAVLNVDATDFASSGNATGSIGTVTNEGTTVYNVVVENIAGAGELGLTVVDATDITDESGNAFSGRIVSTETYSIIDGEASTAAITRLDPSNEITNRSEVTFQIQFSEKIVNFGPSDLQLSENSVTATLGNLRETVDGTTFEMRVTDIEEDGIVGLAFTSSQDIEDESGNAFNGDLTVNETYTIEDVITSIDEKYLGQKKIVVDRNPSDGLFYLAFPNSFAGNFDLGVVNSSGRNIKTELVSNYGEGQQFLLDLSQETDGVYIVRARKGAEILTLKLLKIKN